MKLFLRNISIAIGVLAVVPAAACSGGNEGADDAVPSRSETTVAKASAPEFPAPNPFLADSEYAISHHNSAQQDSTAVPGPKGPTRTLTDQDFDWRFLGPGHFGSVISSVYPDGRRVIWSNGGDRIAKLDASTFEVLATFPLPGKEQWSEGDADAALEQLASAPPERQPDEAIALAARTLVGLSGVYTMIDRDGNLYLSDGRGLTVYGDADPSDPASPIVVRRTWAMPSTVSGALVGMNMTYDGWIILVTENGDVIALSRDLETAEAIRMANSEQAAQYTARAVAEGRTGYGWVRNSYALDEAGGIYIASNDYMHKVVWTGSALSTDPDDGAWSDPYRNETGLGTGATPALMGFGAEEDHLVALTDGDRVMNMTLYWRDEIPADWEQLDGASSPRVAGFLRADMGDAQRTAIQTEQATIVAGYGAAVVNNEPASVPDGYPSGRARSLLAGYLGNDARFTPHGVQKFEWDPAARALEVAWTNQDVASPNSVPFVSVGSGLLYTIGARDDSWTLEGIDWNTGRSAFHFVLPSAKYNSLFAGVTLDQDGNIVYGTPFGKMRIPAGAT